MRPIHALTLALVLALGVVALALFLRSGSQPAPGPNAPIDRTAEHAPATPGATVPVELVRPEGGDDPKHVAGDERDRTRSHVANAPAPAAQTGLRGRVVDGRGRPVAGARVNSDAVDMDELVIDIDLGNGDTLPGHAHVVTDAEGRFVLQPKVKDTTRLSVRAAGFAPYEYRGRGEAVPVANQDLGDLVLEDSAILSGRVLSAAGRPVADAKLKRLRNDAGSSGVVFFGSSSVGGTEVATTDAQGRFRIDQLAAGPWKLRVESVDQPDKIFSGETDRPGATVANLEFVLDEGTTIEGVVLGAPAELLSKLWVRAVQRPSGETSGLNAVISGGEFFGGARKARCNADGSFQVRGCVPGANYRVVARDSERDFGDGRTCTSAVTTPSGERGVKLQYKPETAIVFRVVDATSGAPIEKLEVSGGVGFAMPLMDEKGAPQSRFPGGEVRFVRREGPSVIGQVKHFSLRVAANGYKPYERDDIVPLDAQDTDLGLVRLERAPLVRVLVRDARTKEPLANASVELVERPEERSGERRFERNVRMNVNVGDDGEEIPDAGDSSSSRTDKEGRASLTSLPGKRVEVLVRQRDHAPWASGPFVLPAEGDHELEAALGVGGSVAVTVVDGAGKPVPGVEIDRRGPEGQGGAMLGGVHRPRSDAQGRALFEHLAPGAQRFRIAESSAQIFTTSSGDLASLDFGGGNGNDGWSEVAVVDGEASTLQLVAPERATLVGRISEAGKALAGARVEIVEDDADEEMKMPFFGGGGPNDQTDSQGAFQIERVKLGRYTLKVSHSSRAMEWEGPLEIQSGENKFNVDLPVAILEGRVSGPDGKPLAGVKVRAERAPSEDSSKPTRARFVAIAIASDGGDEPQVTFGSGGTPSPTVLTDAEGRYRLRGVAPDVELVVKAQAKDVQPGQSEKVHVGADQTKSNVDIQLQTGGGVDVSFVRGDGQPANSCMLLATFEGESGVEPRHEFAGAKGVVKLSGLKPGRWKLHCDSFGSPGSNGERASIPEQTIEIVAGKTASARFEIP